eukprot:1133640_1
MAMTAIASSEELSPTFDTSERVVSYSPIASSTSHETPIDKSSDVVPIAALSNALRASIAVNSQGFPLDFQPILDTDEFDLDRENLDDFAHVIAIKQMKTSDPHFEPLPSAFDANSFSLERDDLSAPFSCTSSDLFDYDSMSMQQFAFVILLLSILATQHRKSLLFITYLAYCPLVRGDCQLWLYTYTDYVGQSFTVYSYDAQTTLASWDYNAVGMPNDAISSVVLKEIAPTNPGQGWRYCEARMYEDGNLQGDVLFINTAEIYKPRVPPNYVNTESYRDLSDQSFNNKLTSLSMNAVFYPGLVPEGNGGCVLELFTGEYFQGSYHRFDTADVPGDTGHLGSWNYAAAGMENDAVSSVRLYAKGWATNTGNTNYCKAELYEDDNLKGDFLFLNTRDSQVKFVNKMKDLTMTAISCTGAFKQNCGYAHWNNKVTSWSLQAVNKVAAAKSVEWEMDTYTVHNQIANMQQHEFYLAILVLVLVGVLLVCCIWVVGQKIMDYKRGDFGHKMIGQN